MARTSGSRSIFGIGKLPHASWEWEVYKPESTITIKDACDLFIADAKVRVRPSSVLKYEQSVKSPKSRSVQKPSITRVTFGVMLSYRALKPIRGINWRT